MLKRVVHHGLTVLDFIPQASHLYCFEHNLAATEF